jgi:hypothetical protein
MFKDSSKLYSSPGGFNLYKEKGENMEEDKENTGKKGPLSELCVNEKGELCEVVDFGNERVEYKINGITEHIIFGIYFSFNQKYEY